GDRLDVADIDARFMTAALSLARTGLGTTWPNPSVGTLIIRETPRGRAIVGRGVTMPGGRPHAETQALSEAGEGARGATAYVTLEPCSHYGRTGPCTDALIAAGVNRVVSAMEDPDPRVAGRGHARLADAGVSVAIGTEGKVAERVNAGHVSRIRRGRPHVQLKLAVSGDGFIAGVGGKTQQITGPLAGDRVHMMRAGADAIMVGRGTIEADDPRLTCRLPGMADRSPVRVIVDSDLNVSPRAAIFADVETNPVWLICGEHAPSERESTLQVAGASVIRVQTGEDGHVHLPFALAALAARGITRLMVEGGAHLAASLFRGNLVDEAVIFRAPTVKIGQGVPALATGDLGTTLGQSRYRVLSDETVGADIMTRYWRQS
ncbi:MAG: bifunctional diaminohydroxyphosphoribosylaminopyrimidine deaminase/5-amino-6-(5-phosphoribosylamino)uracil reductase RibD, partial [Pseudomonadota bacterium]